MKRSFAALAVTLLCVPLVMLTAATDALACSCASEPFPAQVDDSDVVFTGRAVEATAAPREPASSLDPVTWTFRVDRVHKGAPAELQQVTSARSEASCGVGFEPGATYVVLAAEQPDGSLSTGLCDGTQLTSGLPPADARVLSPGQAPHAAPAALPVAEPASPAPVAAPTWQLVAGVAALLLVAGLVGGSVFRRRRRRS